MFTKFFKTLCCAVAGISLLVMFTACGEKDDQAGNEPGRTFTVGFDAEFPPYGYKDAETGEYVGLDLDLAREVCKRNNWEFVAKPINWDAKDMELNSGAIDCIWNGFTINGRETAYEWTEPYVDNSQVVLVLKDSGIAKLADLAGKTVAVQTDTPVKKALEEGGKQEALGKTFEELKVTPNYNNAIMELESGGVDAVALDIGVAIDKLKSGKFAMLSEVVITEKYGVGFKKGNTELRDQVQKTFKEMVADGTAAKISGKYFKGKNIIILK